MQYDVLAMGEPMFELNQQPDGRFLPGFGGDTSNVAIAAARLGAKASVLTKLGGDPFGDAITELWRRENVDSHAVTRHPAAPTGIYLVTHSDHRHSFSYYRQGSAASLLSAADVPRELISAARFLHVSGISQAISVTAAGAVDHAIAIARAADVKLSYDTNLRLRLWPLEQARPVIDKTAAMAHVLKTSVEDAQQLLDLADPVRIAGHFLDLGSAIVVVTLGAHGVYVADARTGQEVAGFDIDAVDATGAGDAFTGAFLTELARGRDLDSAARFANAAAALSTLGYGAVAPLPRRAEVESFLKLNATGAFGVSRA
ncbi:MAG: sugar kinase [Pseudomonadota bacterium]|nr:sugar kinase [Pseudomonadota bacterium]